MFCRECGAELRIKEGARFCGKCGAPVKLPQNSESKKETVSLMKSKETIHKSEIKRKPEPEIKRKTEAEIKRKPEPEKKSVLISSMPKPGSSGTSSNGETDIWFSDPGDL